MKTMKEREIKGIYALVTGVFLIFLLVPILLLLGKSFEYQGGIALSHYADVLTGKGFAGVFAPASGIGIHMALSCTSVCFRYRPLSWNETDVCYSERWHRGTLLSGFQRYCRFGKYLYTALFLNFAWRACHADTERV